MIFNSLNYLFFFTIVAIVFYLLPQKCKRPWLLVASYFFYATWDVRYVLLLLGATVITYLAGLYLEKGEADKKGRGLILTLAIILGVGAISVFKYANFAISNINHILHIIKSPGELGLLEIVLPVGISFYILQSLGYIIDVYKGKIQAEHNFFIYALFVSFFPQICSGPIGRADKLMPQYRGEIIFNESWVKSGMLSFAYGLFLKLVVADNVALFIKPMFDNPGDYSGMQLLLAAAFFPIQLYCDFSGYSLMAWGSGKMLQVELIRNFRQPFLADSFRKFWRGWHISLTSWFTDYLYIPLGGNRKGRIRKCINTVIVFAVSGLWHGAAWHFVIWGFLCGLLLVGEELVGDSIGKLVRSLKVDVDAGAWKVTKSIFIYIMMLPAWIFFRADNFGTAISMFRGILPNIRLSWFLSEGFTASFASPVQMLTILVSVLIVFVIDLLEHRDIDVKEIIFSKQLIYRWIIYFALLFVIVVWGAYGEGFEQTNFIYFEF